MLSVAQPPLQQLYLGLEVPDRAVDLVQLPRNVLLEATSIEDRFIEQYLCAASAAVKLRGVPKARNRAAVHRAAVRTANRNLNLIPKSHGESPTKVGRASIVGDRGVGRTRNRSSGPASRGPKS